MYPGDSRRGKYITSDTYPADGESIWIMRVAQATLRSAALPYDEADRIGREIAIFLSDSVNMRDAIAAYGTDDGFEVAERMTRDMLKAGLV